MTGSKTGGVEPRVALVLGIMIVVAVDVGGESDELVETGFIEEGNTVGTSFDEEGGLVSFRVAALVRWIGDEDEALEFDKGSTSLEKRVRRVRNEESFGGSMIIKPREPRPRKKRKMRVQRWECRLGTENHNPLRWSPLVVVGWVLRVGRDCSWLEV